MRNALCAFSPAGPAAECYTSCRLLGSEMRKNTFAFLSLYVANNTPSDGRLLLPDTHSFKPASKRKVLKSQVYASLGRSLKMP